MDWLLRALNGSRAGSTYEIKGEITIGRAGQIVVDDPRVSSLHARIKQDESGNWYLYDNRSKNGIRNAKGERIESLPLSLGVSFYIGEIQFEVVAGSASAAKAASVGPPAVEPKGSGAAESKKKKYWNDILAEYLENHTDALIDAEKSFRPLSPAVVLDFIKGVQVNSKWVIGYGPRRIGATMIDLPIWEPGAPDVCFELTPTDEGLLFKTKHPKVVQLNGKPVASQILRMGDNIRILETLIEVDFSE
jgi:hypothetical protein